jgi:hypothetical protein
MSEVKVTFSTSRLPGADQVVDRLPPVLRIQSIARFPFDERTCCVRPFCFTSGQACGWNGCAAIPTAD